MSKSVENYIRQTGSETTPVTVLTESLWERTLFLKTVETVSHGYCGKIKQNERL